MKVFKKIATMFLAVLMLMSSLTANAMAVELSEVSPSTNTAKLVSVEYGTDGSKTATYEFDVPQTSAEGDYGIMPLTIDQTFNMTSSHRGGDRTYSGNKLSISTEITGANGNAVDNTVSVQLHDYNHSYALFSANLPADGRLRTYQDISITAGRTYYFYYKVLSGTSRTLKVRMIIQDYKG